jgi:hypothetical protein
MDVEHFIVNRDVLSFTQERLATRGREQLEAFVLWGGRRDIQHPQVLNFTSAIFPTQTAYRTKQGLLVVIESDSLFEVNKMLFARDEILAAQIHTHPTDAYHSETDDTQPVVTILGGLSVVIPDFAAGGIAAYDRWAWYRLRELGRWDSLPANIRVELR